MRLSTEKKIKSLKKQITLSNELEYSSLNVAGVQHKENAKAQNLPQHNQ